MMKMNEHEESEDMDEESNQKSVRDALRDGDDIAAMIKSVVYVSVTCLVVVAIGLALGSIYFTWK